MVRSVANRRFGGLALQILIEQCANRFAGFVLSGEEVFLKGKFMFLEA